MFFFKNNFESQISELETDKSIARVFTLIPYENNAAKNKFTQIIMKFMTCEIDKN